MKIETLMWLLPIIFMFHDFEEIIMMKIWLKKNLPVLHLPAIACHQEIVLSFSPAS
jgi:hypothetical protein